MIYPSYKVNTKKIKQIPVIILNLNKKKLKEMHIVFNRFYISKMKKFLYDA